MTANIDEAISSYKKVCMNFDIDPILRLQTLVSFIQNIPDEGIDMYQRYKDSIKFISPRQQYDNIFIITKIALMKHVLSFDQIFFTGITLFNLSYFQESFEVFLNFLKNENILLDQKIEVCKYLYTSVDNRDLVKYYVLSIINNDKIECKKRFGCIMTYASFTGISMLLNKNRIRIEYDENFIIDLLIPFFNNETNDIYYRLLSAKFLLETKNIDTNIRENVEIIVEKIASYHNDIKIRADAIDILLRLSEKRKPVAETLLEEISKLSLNTVQTIFQNSQNVHKFVSTNDFEQYISIIQDTIQLKPYDVIFEEIISMINNHNLSPEDRNIIDLSLSHINYDSSLFTSKKLSLSMILSYVWLDIQQHPEKDTLENRLIEELKESYSTCSSGYFMRIVNTLSAFRDVNIKMTFEEQINSNLFGRMNALIKKNEDADVLMSGMIGSSNEDEDKNFYLDFVRKSIPALKIEMYEEFVKGNYIDENLFEDFFTKAMTKMLQT